MDSLQGRRAELDAIERFLDAVDGGTSTVFLLSGQAGIGKTTLWRAGIVEAADRGFATGVAQPTEVETGLAFAALGDVLGALLDADLPPLPEPQLVALNAALLRAPTAVAPHPLGVALATLHVLRAAAERSPVLVAVDDVPWLDEASARAMAFAVRRLDHDRVGFLLARRTAAADDPLPGWVATIPAERLGRVDVGPLSVDETGALLRERLALSLARPALVRLHAIAGGSPFYALELGRDLQIRGSREAGHALEVPRSLDRLIGARLDALGPDADEATLVASALAQPTVRLVAAAMGTDRAEVGLAEAKDAVVLETTGDIVRFVHPLLAAAAYARANPDRVRGLHERLATIVTEPEEQARHLSRTAVGPDARIADALEQAAASARRRGASELAAELAEDAARLTPADDADGRDRRLAIAADDLVVSGDLHGADRLLEAAAAGRSDGPLLADILTRRARIALYLMDHDLAERLLRDAMPLTAKGSADRVRVHELLAGLGHLTWRRAARLDMWEALRLARHIDDRPLELEILGHAATWRFGLGRPWRPLIGEADALVVPIDAVPALEHPDLQFARLLAREGDGVEGRRRIGRLVESARARGDWTSLPRLQVSAATVELEAGDWGAADRIARESEAGLLQSGEGAFLLDLAIIRLNLSVLRGDVDAARSLGAGLELEVRNLPMPLTRAGPRIALGLLEVSLGDSAAALGWLDPVVAAPGLGRLLPVWWETVVALHTEALVGLGRADETRSRIDHLEQRARRRGPPAAHAEALRARAVALAASGDHETAVRSSEEAVAIHADLQLPFRAARAWFTLGEVRRRWRRRAASRAAFETALERFSGLGAQLWVERTRSELGRVAGRRPAGSALTDTERRVAELAGAGQTNKEIADALFMSVHTVEAHLTRIFRTLGVQSRTELARADLDGSPASLGPQP